MRKRNTAIARMLVPAFFAAAILAGPAMAQEKKAERVMKVLVDNDKVRATESVWKPGEGNPMEARAFRVTRVISGSSTMERTHADGKKETVQMKQGDVFAWGPDKVSMKNVGKAPVVTYTVTPKTK